MRVRMGIAGKSECGRGRREMNVLRQANKEAAAERPASASAAGADT